MTGYIVNFDDAEAHIKNHVKPLNDDRNLIEFLDKIDAEQIHKIKYFEQPGTTGIIVFSYLRNEKKKPEDLRHNKA